MIGLFLIIWLVLSQPCLWLIYLIKHQIPIKMVLCWTNCLLSSWKVRFLKLWKLNFQSADLFVLIEPNDWFLVQLSFLSFHSFVPTWISYKNVLNHHLNRNSYSECTFSSLGKLPNDSIRLLTRTNHHMLCILPTYKHMLLNECRNLLNSLLPCSL